MAVLVAFALYMAVAATPGRAAERLVLEQAMTQAREQAAGPLAAQAREEVSVARLRQARAHRKPQVRLQEVWTRTNSPAEAFGLVLNQERFSLADFSAGDPNDPGAVENALTRLEIALPIYTGGEIEGRIRQAELARESSELSADWAGDRAAWRAAEAYIHLIQSREGVELLERALETVGAHVSLAAAYVEQGLLVRSELLRAEVERARVHELLAGAQSRERLAVANLSFRIGAGEPRDWTLESLAPPGTMETALDHFLASADSRADLQAALRQLEAGGLEEKIMKSALLPRVGVAARHDRYSESLLGSSGDSTAVVAMATVDLFSGGRHRAAAASARSEAEAGRHEVEQLRQAVRLEVRSAYERALSARERQATAAATLVAAREAERIVRERFEQGVAKTLDVLDAATALREAEGRELVARADAHLASLRLAVDAGLRPESALSQASGASSPPPDDETTTGQG